MKRQRTITVNNERITIVSRPKTRQGNLMGWNIDINGERIFKMALGRRDAENKAFRQWVENHAAV